MSSSTLNIAVPEPFKSYVEAHVEDGSYASPADYIQQLIEVQQQREAAGLQNRLDVALAREQLEQRGPPLTPEELAGGNIIELFRKKLAENA